MLSYILRRLLIAIPTVLGAATVSFSFMRLIPGDPAVVMAGMAATPEQVERLRVQFGLDGSVWSQYVAFMGRLVRGDLGISVRTAQPVVHEVASRAQATLELAGSAVLIAILVGGTIGVLAALSRGKTADTILSVFAVFGVSMPVYWIGLLLIIVFAVNLGWLPAAGSTGPFSIVLPAVTLSFYTTGFIARQTRSAMLEVLRQDYIRTARSKGLPERVVVLKHALRNAALPVVTVIGLQLGQLMGGAILTESIFAWPGIGRLIVESIASRDFPVVQGTVFVFAIVLILVNLMTDLAYASIDPRIRYD